MVKLLTAIKFRDIIDMIDTHLNQEEVDTMVFFIYLISLSHYLTKRDYQSKSKANGITHSLITDISSE